MQKEEVYRLAQRLALASPDDLHHADSELIRDIERLAREDLYEALRVWQGHASDEIQDSKYWPEILTVALVIKNKFEGRKCSSHGPVNLPGYEPAVVTLPISRRTYQGKVIAETPVYVVQKEGDTYILHERQSLTLDPSSIGDNVRIRYPFDSINGIGIVNEHNPSDSIE